MKSDLIGAAWASGGVCLMAAIYGLFNEFRGQRAWVRRVEAVRKGNTSQADQMQAEYRERVRTQGRWLWVSLPFFLLAIILILIS